MTKRSCPPTGNPVPGWVARVAAVTGVAMALMAPGVALADSDRICVSVEVPDPIRLPDGRLHPAGDLTLCDSVSFSPVSSLHKTFVNGRPVGLFMSRKSLSEAPAGLAPQVMFRSDGKGNLTLLGYVLPATNKNVAYLLSTGSKGARKAKKRREPPVDVASAAGGPGQGLRVIAATYP